MIVGFMAGVTERADREFPLRVFLGQPPAVMRVLIEQVQNGPVRTRQRMRARNFDQLAGFGKANDVRALGKGYGHEMNSAVVTSRVVKPY